MIANSVPLFWQKTVANRAANIIRRKGDEPAQADPVAEVEAPVVEEELHPAEFDLEDDAEADEIEALKAAETAEYAIKPASEAPEFVMPDVTKAPGKKK